MVRIESEKDSNAVREDLSYAFLHAVIGHARGSCEYAGRGADGAGIDARCVFSGQFTDTPGALQKIEFNVQLKATSRCQEPIVKKTGEYWSLSLETKLLRKYVRPGIPPLLLVLFCIPREEEYDGWLTVDEEQATLRKCAYWTPFEGYAVPTEQKTATIYIPKKNVLTPESIVRDIVVPLAKREELKYETP